MAYWCLLECVHIRLRAVQHDQTAIQSGPQVGAVQHGQRCCTAGWQCITKQAPGVEAVKPTTW